MLWKACAVINEKCLPLSTVHLLDMLKNISGFFKPVLGPEDLCDFCVLLLFKSAFNGLCKLRSLMGFNCLTIGLMLSLGLILSLGMTFTMVFKAGKCQGSLKCQRKYFIFFIAWMINCKLSSIIVGSQACICWPDQVSCCCNASTCKTD